MQMKPLMSYLQELVGGYFFGTSCTLSLMLIQQ